MLEFRQANGRDELMKVFKLRYQVYCLEKCFLPSSDYPEGVEVDEFDTASVHFVAMHTVDGQELVGTMRLILDSDNGFPVEKHFRLTKPITNRQTTIELSRLIVAPSARIIAIPILMGLAREIYWYCNDHQIEDCYAVLEEPLLKMLKRIRFPFHVAGKEQWYMGGLTRPAYLSVSETVRVMVRSNAIFREYLTESKGNPMILS
ncbi:MAG TPA: GNAT family N-acyltransferase [Patescibacteria group bacterium]|nr:GNAT family N-acyltransferase [Patescibacteria group bacterium]